MQWQRRKLLLKKKLGKFRIKKKFLFVPRQFGNDPIVRWLEYANILEQVEMNEAGSDMQGNCWFESYFWREVKFASKEDEKNKNYVEII